MRSAAPNSSPGRGFPVGSEIGSKGRRIWLGGCLRTRRPNLSSFNAFEHFCLLVSLYFDSSATALRYAVLCHWRVCLVFFSVTVGSFCDHCVFSFLAKNRNIFSKMFRHPIFLQKCPRFPVCSVFRFSGLWDMFCGERNAETLGRGGIKNRTNTLVSPF